MSQLTTHLEKARQSLEAARSFDQEDDDKNYYTSDTSLWPRTSTTTPRAIPGRRRLSKPTPSRPKTSDLSHNNDPVSDDLVPEPLAYGLTFRAAGRPRSEDPSTADPGRQVTSSQWAGHSLFWPTRDTNSFDPSTTDPGRQIGTSLLNGPLLPVDQPSEHSAAFYHARLATHSLQVAIGQSTDSAFLSASDASAGMAYPHDPDRQVPTGPSADHAASAGHAPSRSAHRHERALR